MIQSFKIFRKHFLKGMQLFGESIAAVINTLLLLIAYFAGIGTTWIIALFFNKHFLKLYPQSNDVTYWEDIPDESEAKDYYYRQF